MKTVNSISALKSQIVKQMESAVTETGYRYDPSGRETQTIYNYAADGGLVGNGGFWAKTKEDFEHNMKNAFGKRFK